MKPTIKIDIVSDVVCPWCYIGKRRLEKAIRQLSDEYNFELEYHPFELNPDAPVKGVSHKEHLIDKFGSEDRYEQMTGHVTNVAAQEGLSFQFGDGHVLPNTRKAHSILQYALEEDKQIDVMEAFFKAYFTDGKDLSNDDTLIDVAVAAGLERNQVEKVLADDNALVQVAMEEKEMHKLGISGVPFYIINNRYGVSGAQASETFVQAFQQIGKEVVVTDNAGACDVDGENC